MIGIDFIFIRDRTWKHMLQLARGAFRESESEWADQKERVEV